jgi:hypothetical protein
MASSALLSASPSPPPSAPTPVATASPSSSTVLPVVHANLLHAFEYDVAQIGDEEVARRQRRTVRILLIRLLHHSTPFSPSLIVIRDEKLMMMI